MKENEKLHVSMKRKIFLILGFQDCQLHLEIKKTMKYWHFVSAEPFLLFNYKECGIWKRRVTS